MANKSTSDKTSSNAVDAKGSDQIDKSVQQVQEAADAAVKRIHEALDTMAAKAGHGVSEGAEKAGRAAHKVVSGGESLGETGQAALGSVRTYVRDNPTQSVLIALAAGWVVGRLMQR